MLSSGLTLTDKSFHRLSVCGGISRQNTGSLAISQDGQDVEFDIQGRCLYYHRERII